MAIRAQTGSMLPIPPSLIPGTMHRSVTGALADDPVLPDRRPIRPLPPPAPEPPRMTGTPATATPTS